MGKTVKQFSPSVGMVVGFGMHPGEKKTASDNDISAYFTTVGLG